MSRFASKFTRAGLAGAAVILLGVASQPAQARNPYPPGWNKPQQVAPTVNQFVPGSDRLHAATGQAPRAVAAAASTGGSTIAYQFTPGGKRLHAVSN